MIKNKKRFVAFAIVLMLVIQSFGGNCFAAAISEKKTVQTIAPGVTLTNVDAYYSGFDLTYSYITADLSSDKVALSLLKSKAGINERETVKNLALTEENVVAATNCDFFAMSTNSFSQGIEFKDGRLLQSPIDTNAFAGGFLYDDNKLVLSEIDFHITAIAPNKESREVYRLNKPMELYGLLLMYTSDYNDGYSPAPGNGVVEMIVEDDIVVGFNREKEPVKIPENGYVLLMSEADNFLSANFKEGDEVELEYRITPELENLKMAFGGGSMLVKDGQVCKFTNNIAGNHPRTAVGIDKSGKILKLLTVDGRSTTSEGLSQTLLANLMIELGCDMALNLDGGGSTQMVAKTWEGKELKTVNKPTENRKVINALGIKSFEEETDQISHLRLSADKKTVYKGESVNLTLEAANSAYTRLFIDTTGTKYNTDAVYGNVFKSDKGGDFLVNASIGDIVSNDIEIKVIDEIAGISLPRVYNFEKAGETADIRALVFDKDGNSAEAPLNEFEIEIVGSCASIENGKIVAKSEGEALISVKKDNVCSYSRVVVGGRNGKVSVPLNTLYDYQNKVESGEKTFVYTALADETNTLFDNLYASKLADILPKYNRVAVLGNQTHPLLDEVYCVNYDKYKYLEKDGAAFISLPVKNGSVRSANVYAYDNLINDLNNTTAKNVFITADGYFDLNGREGEAIKEALSKYEKNIYVITKGETDNVEIINSVRYFTLADNHSYHNLFERVKEIKMLKFSVSEDKVTYSFENIYTL